METNKITLNKKVYDIRLTRKARIEIEEFQRKTMKKISQKEENIEAISVIGELQDFEKELKAIQDIEDEEERNSKELELNNKMIKAQLILSSSDILDTSNSLDGFEVLYIVIKNNINNEKISKDEFYNGIDKLEQEIGMFELEKLVAEINKKVFTEMKLLKEMLNDFNNPTEEAKEQEKVN